MFNDICLVRDARDGKLGEISAALGLAAANDKPLTVCNVLGAYTLPAAASVGGASIGVVPEVRIDEDEREAVRAKLELRHAEASRLARKAGSALVWELQEGIADTVMERVAARARLHDLCVAIGPGQDEDPWWAVMLEKLIRGCGRPCLVLPEEKSDLDYRHDVQICWDGSSSAARAVFDAMPFLRKADRIVILEVGDVEDYDQNSAEHLRQHLANHGLDSEVRVRGKEGTSVSDRMVSHAVEEGCTLLVMGAFDESWLKRLVFGSVTDSTIREPSLPVLVSH